jgi:hypothetical protein
MSVTAKKVAIRRSELHTVERIVPLWELPLLEAIHAVGAVVPLEDVVLADRDLPDAQTEYERLEARYKLARKDDGSIGDAVVADVYGKHGAGIQALKRAIAEAEVEEDSLV